MIYLIAYDVEDDKQRLRISNLLEDYGVRVQRSVFECKLTSLLYKKFINKLKELITDEVNIRIYPLCKECCIKAVGFGTLKKLPGLKGYEII
ncbi:MAG TPA: CRISPR-associated endonuclease Cas2 [Ignavibacteria bacterium]|nr:CRISPR-associated endonuclease Cas2 [Ignavibacteria bacterium]